MIDIVYVYTCIDCGDSFEKYQMVGERCETCDIRHDYGEDVAALNATIAAQAQRIADFEAERAAPQAGLDGMPDDVREAMRLLLDELRPHLIVDGYKPQLVWEASQAIEAWLGDAPAPQAVQEADDEG